MAARKEMEEVEKLKNEFWALHELVEQLVSKSIYPYTQEEMLDLTQSLVDYIEDDIWVHEQEIDIGKNLQGGRHELL